MHKVIKKIPVVFFIELGKRNAAELELPSGLMHLRQSYHKVVYFIHF
jgi:hypothetical protein